MILQSNLIQITFSVLFCQTYAINHCCFQPISSNYLSYIEFLIILFFLIEVEVLYFNLSQYFLNFEVMKMNFFYYPKNFLT